jgi:Ca-activated chloride channel family protein
MKSSPSPADWTPDSPELTAFALKDGPFDPSVPGWAERRAAAEQAVARSAPLRAEIGEIRRVADDVETDLSREAIHRLSADRREAVLAYARNPGRGLPRRSSAGSSPEGDSGWHRLWSVVTRPAMGYSLAAATALSIGLALWSAWPPASRPSPAVAVRSGASNALAEASPSISADPSAPAPTPMPASASASDTPSIAQPREEILRGEPQLAWGSPGRLPGPSTASTTSVLPGSPASVAGLKRYGLSPSADSARTPSSAASTAALSAAAPAADVARKPEVLQATPVAPTTQAKTSIPSPRAQTTREIPFQSAATAPRSTFPLKPGNTSYPQIRKALQDGQLPSPDAVRLEELLNYFSYDYPAPSGSDPVSAQVEVADSPWSPDHRLVKIGLQARPAQTAVRPRANLVVLVGLSPGSSARLSWAQRSLQALIEALDGRDSLALLIDGPQGRLILPPTTAADRASLIRGVRALRAEGAPRGLEGLRRAYALADQHHVPGGINRVVWIVDGEFSAEAGTREALATLIREQTDWGVFLSVMGLGAEVPPESSETPWMPTPAGGAYASAATPSEAQAVLRRELQPTPASVAENVTVDVRFNPARVDQWRLLSQESQAAAADPNPSPTRSGAQMEAGRSVTALYEIVPTRPTDRPQPGSGSESAAPAGGPNDLLNLEVGYRSPANGRVQDPAESSPARSLQVGVPDVRRSSDAATADYKFAAAVVGYGLMLRDSPFKGDLTWEKVQILAEEGQGPDREGYRAEFLQLVRQARALQGGAVPNRRAQE